LRLSRKLGIAALAVVAVLVPLSVLANDDGTGEERPFGRRWYRWFGSGDGESVDEAVERMAERLNLTEEEIAEVGPIAEEIADLRAQLRAKMEELHEIIGTEVDAYRESVMSERSGRHPRGYEGRCGIPYEESSDEGYRAV
jgi:Spy/CpxP family protein refolding chaperone